jgi:hypothetical protein
MSILRTRLPILTRFISRVEYEANNAMKANCACSEGILIHRHDHAHHGLLYTQTREKQPDDPRP